MPCFLKKFDSVARAADMGEEISEINPDPGVGRVEFNAALEQPESHVEVSPLKVDIAECGVAGAVAASMGCPVLCQGEGAAEWRLP